MKLPVLKLINRELSSLNLLEFVLPVLNLIIGLGVVYHFAVKMNLGIFLQIVVLFIFLELGSQFFEFHKRNYLTLWTRKERSEEKRASALFVILFYSLAILPLSQILRFSGNNKSFLLILSISGFVTLIWRNLGRTPVAQLVSIFLFSINNAFFLPLTQLFFYHLNIKPILITISQIIFLNLFGYLILREILKIELQKKESGIVRMIGTISLLRISALLLVAGWILLVAFVIRQPAVLLITLVIITAGLLLFILNEVFNLFRLGKGALSVIWRMGTLLVFIEFLGWGAFLFVH